MSSMNNTLNLLQLKDEQAFSSFYESTKRLIYFVIRQYIKNDDETEDILQESYIEFLSSIDEVKNDKSLISYLLKIAKNKSLNYLKRENKKRAFKEDEEDLIPSHDSYSNIDLINEVQSLLKPFEFQLVYLKIVENYSHQEIASMLCKPLGTVLWAYNNAMKKLKKGLKHYE